jgi:aryl-alcohol dehydrogenase (NADP+)
MIPLCRAEGVAVIPYSPIARGFVTGERRTGDWGDTVRAKTDDYMKKLYYTPQDFAITDRITEVSRRLGLLNVQVALAWVLHQPGITAPIIGVTKLDQLDQLCGSLAVKPRSISPKKSYRSCRGRRTELSRPRLRLININ